MQKPEEGVAPAGLKPPTSSRKRLIVHVMYSFGIGGLENVIVQLINTLPSDRYDHVVLSLTTVSDFKNRITRDDVRFVELHKAAGHAFSLYPKIYQILRALKPAVVHTCNLAALEIVPIAALAGVPLRVHAEHGWDAHDPDGTNPRYQWLRRAYRPFVSRYVAVSKDIQGYLHRRVGIPNSKIVLIANGVDTDVFTPHAGARTVVRDLPFDPAIHWLIGCVGRLQTVKNQPLLVRAFLRVLADHPDASERLRLVIVGDGPLRADIEVLLKDAGKSHLVWLAGARSDVADVMKMFHCFVLPSQAEGTSCTLQEAMATGLPIVATAVGGTPDLVADGLNGLLVPSGDEAALANAIWQLYSVPDVALKMQSANREKAISKFALSGMIVSYCRIFDGASLHLMERA